MTDIALVAGGAVVAHKAGKKLLGPLADRLGIAIADLGDVYHFYQTQFLVKIFTKWAESRGDKPPLTEEELKRVLPLLPLASVQFDEELHRHWAALLEHAATSPGTMSVSFGHTLSQLTAEEAKFLDRLLAKKREDGRALWLSDSEMFKVLDPRIEIAPHTRPRPLTKEQDEANKRLDHAWLVLRDLIRLGLLLEETGDNDYVTIPDGYEEGHRVVLYQDEKRYYPFSAYGEEFIRAVTAPQ
jgi:hypothetical protein